MEKNIELQSLTDTEELARELAKTAHGGDILTLSGEIGTGKTTFAQAFAAALGIKQSVTSPTFTLMNIYELPQSVNGISQLVHIDAYRTESIEEIKAAGIEDFLHDPAAIVLIEWPENCAEIIPSEKKTALYFESKNGIRSCKIASI